MQHGLFIGLCQLGLDDWVCDLWHVWFVQHVDVRGDSGGQFGPREQWFDYGHNRSGCHRDVQHWVPHLGLFSSFGHWYRDATTGAFNTLICAANACADMNVANSNYATATTRPYFLTKVISPQCQQYCHLTL